MKAAQTLYAERPVASITINDLVNEAGVAKGTFYVHFKHLGELQAAVAYELAQNFDDLLQPLRMALTDPVERVAAGCAAFIQEALQNPAWGRLLANCAWALPPVASAANENLREDLELAMAQARLSTVAP